MDKIDRLKKEIIEAKKKKEKKAFEERVISSLDSLHKAIKAQPKPKSKIKVTNFPIQNDQINVVNLKDIKFPEEVSVKNLSDIIIPPQVEFPKEIKVKKPDWFSTKDIVKEIAKLKESFVKVIQEKAFSMDKHTRKENALAVRLVDKDGRSFYSAFGGAGSGGGVEGFHSKVTVDNFPIDYATSAKQLPDGHGVNVDNIADTPLIIGFATSAKQLADNHQVTVSNIANTPLITGYSTLEKQKELQGLIQSLYTVIQNHLPQIARGDLKVLTMSGSVISTVSNVSQLGGISAIGIPDNTQRLVSIQSNINNVAQ